MAATREDRFRAKYNTAESGCWIWTGARGAALTEHPYGIFKGEDRVVLAHRWSYEHFVGPIPDGHVIDHLCKVTLCVNPEHLQAVTQKTNLRRGDTFQARNAAKTHCPAGHTYDEANTRFKTSRGVTRRVCKKCEAEQSANRRAGMPKKGRPTGDRSGSARLTWEKVREIRRLAADGQSRTDLARRFGVAIPTIRSIVINKSWIE